MKKIKLLSIGLLLCSGIAHSDNNVGSAAEGAKSWADNCARCHNPRPGTEFSAAQWQPIMLHMRIQAGLTGEEARNIYAFLANQSSPPQQPSAPGESSPKTLPAKSGETIYHQTCVACHGKDGKGVLPGVPNFAGASSPLKQSDQVLLSHIKNGFQSPGSPMAMPPKGGNSNLTDEELRNVLSYIRSHFEHP